MHKVKVKIFDEDMYIDGEQYKDLPEYATLESAGMDLRTTKDFILLPNSQVLVSTGLAIHIDNSKLAAIILPRSGLGHKQQIVLGNLVGLIDSDYQGELMLSVWNRGNEVRYFRRGDRLAQIVFVPITRVQLEVVSSFEDSTRGTGGWGSTGL